MTRSNYERNFFRRVTRYQPDDLILAREFTIRENGNRIAIRVAKLFSARVLRSRATFQFAARNDRRADGTR